MQDHCWHVILIRRLNDHGFTFYIFGFFPNCNIQKTAISLLSLYLMSSSMVMMNMNTKKTPAPPRKCQMSCLGKRSYIRLYLHHQLQHQRQNWSKNLHQSKQKLSVSQKSDWSFFKSRFFLLAHRKSRIIDRAGSARATPLVKRSNSSPCEQRTTLRARSTGLQELENKNVENRTLLRKYFSLPKYHQAR